MSQDLNIIPTKRNQSFLHKWLIPRLKQKRLTMMLRHLMLKNRTALKKDQKQIYQCLSEGEVTGQKEKFSFDRLPIDK